MSTRLLLVRHGETDAAVTGRTQGRIDNPLNARGEAQARALVERLARERPTAIYSSPAARALATAAPLEVALGLEALRDTRLLEMDYGDFDNLTGAELRERHPDFMRSWAEEDPTTLRMPGGETLSEVQARMLAVVAEIERARVGEVVAVFSHGFALRTLICAVLGVPVGGFRRVRLDLASVSIIEVSDAGRIVVQLNEACHIPD
ncbi:MAG: histidine phosphatase family protein [Dehalococcoidia bacterium]